MEFINPTGFELSRRGGVCVVGCNGGLRGSGLGGLVDAYGVVVRFNRDKTRGYEADVGGRCDVRVVSSDLYYRHRFSRGFVGCCVGVDKNRPRKVLRWDRGRVDRGVIDYWGVYRWSMAFSGRFGRQFHRLGFISTGMVTVMWLVANRLFPTCVGFGRMSNGKYWYPDDWEIGTGSRYHKIDGEFDLLCELAEAGYLRLI